MTVKLNANYEPSRDDDEQDCLGGYDFDFGPAHVATVTVTTADSDIDSSSRKHCRRVVDVARGACRANALCHCCRCWVYREALILDITLWLDFGHVTLDSLEA